MNVITFKIVPLGSYTPMETLFPLLVAALEVCNRHGLQHVRYKFYQGFFYKDVLERLRKRVIHVRVDIAEKWMFHHDNDPCHTAVSVTEILNSKTFLWFSSPPHLTSARVTFPKLKNVLNGRHFGTLEYIQKSVMDMLKTIPVKDFQHCY
jgi:hypothetical protein